VRNSIKVGDSSLTLRMIMLVFCNQLQ